MPGFRSEEFSRKRNQFLPLAYHHRLPRFYPFCLSGFQMGMGRRESQKQYFVRALPPSFLLFLFLSSTLNISPSLSSLYSRGESTELSPSSSPNPAQTRENRREALSHSPHSICIFYPRAGP
jgi:hypothetical protein